MAFLSDIEIAQQAAMEPIVDVAKNSTLTRMILSFTASIRRRFLLTFGRR